MKAFLILVLICTTTAKVKDNTIKLALQSPRTAVNMYNEFKAEQRVEYNNRRENTLRYREFLNSAELVAQANDDEDDDAEYEINFTSLMTDLEKMDLVGFNTTGHEPNEPDISLTSSVASYPSSKSFISEGKVTAVKNQQTCGSCWTYAAIVPIEALYKEMSGVLRSFSEQEYLSCTYSTNKGCGGGWMNDAYQYSIRNGGRLAAEKDYKYANVDTHCYKDHYKNAMIAAKITGFKKVAGDEQSHIKALQTTPIGVAFEVTNKFHVYRKGIFRETYCYGHPTHAVAIVGYTSTFVLVKNSWGSHWGDQGFIKFARNHHNCQLWKWSSYPVLQKTGQKDNGGNDRATDYKDGGSDGGNDGGNDGGDCRDSYTGTCLKHWCSTTYKKYCKKTCGLCGDSNCKDKHTGKCYTAWCHLDYIKNDLCQKTCGTCSGGDGGNNGGCPPGTKKCSDGVCRHEHMC